MLCLQEPYRHINKWRQFSNKRGFYQNVRSYLWPLIALHPRFSSGTAIFSSREPWSGTPWKRPSTASCPPEYCRLCSCPWQWASCWRQFWWRSCGQASSLRPRWRWWEWNCWGSWTSLAALRPSWSRGGKCWWGRGSDLPIYWTFHQTSFGWSRPWELERRDRG